MTLGAGHAKKKKCDTPVGETYTKRECLGFMSK